MELLVRRGQHLTLIDHIHTERLQNLRLDKVSDPGLPHHRDGDRIDDLGDLLWIGHTGHAPGRPDVGRDSLKRHNSDGTGIFSEHCLLCIDDVHDDTAIQQ